MREPVTDIPGIILKTTLAGSRIAFVPANIDSQFAGNNLPDHGNLLKNIVRWAVKEDIPFSVTGAGLIDCHLYGQAGKLILHIINLTSAATWRQPLDELIAIGPLTCKVKLSPGMFGKDIQLKVSGKKLTRKLYDGWVQFEIGSITDHELVIISG